MIAIPKPFQPVSFSRDQSCACPTIDRCGPVGGRYANLVQYNDITQVQMTLDLCGEETQLIDNPNFQNSDSPQSLLNGQFESGLDDWTYEGDEPDVTDDELTLDTGTTAFGQVPQNFNSSQQYLIRINVLSNTGTLTIDTAGGTVEVTTTGVFQQALSLPQTGFNIYQTDGESVIDAIQAYRLDGIEDWITSGQVFVQDGIAQLSGNAILSSQSLSPNTEYLIRFNVTQINGNPIIFSALNESIPIVGTGIHEVVLTTSFTGDLFIASNGGVLSVSFVEAYIWGNEDPASIEVFNSSDVSMYTLTASDVLYSANSLTINIPWGDILVDDDPLPEGTYYFVVTQPSSCENSPTYTSEPFYLKENHECSFQIIACMDNDGLGFEFEGFTPSVRLTAEYTELSYPNERVEFTDNEDKLTKYHATINEIQSITTMDIPKYLLRFLGTLPAYSRVYLNGEVYSVDNGSVDPQMNPTYPTWGTAELQFKLVNYPLIFTKCGSNEVDCAPPPNCWLWPDGNELLWEDDLDNVCVLYN